MAEQRVIANLAGVDEEIRKLQRSAKQAANAVKDISVNLQFDPQNIELIAQRFSSLREELQVNQDNLATFNERLEELKRQQQELNEFVGPLSPEQRKQTDEIRRAIEKYEKAIDDTTRRINYLKAASDEKVEADRKAAIAQEELRKKHEKTTQALESAERATKAMAVAVTAFVGALAKAVKSSIELGTELYNLSIRYDTNVKQIQIWNRALQLATGQANLFTTAVNTMIKGLSQISAGRGVAYRKALQNIGLAYKDLETMSTEGRFRAIVEAMGETADANVRLEAAQQLLGESGQSIAQMFEKETFNLDAYLESASKYGTLTQDNAVKLAQMGFQMEYVKSQMAVATAQMTEALTPAIEVLLGFVENLTNVIKGLSGALGGNNEAAGRLMILIGSAVIVLPVLIKLIKDMARAFAIATTAASAFQKALGWISLVLDGIALLISVVTPAIVSMSHRADEATDSINGLADAAGNLSLAGADFGANVESVSQTNTYRKIEVETTVRGEGDTPISDEAAVNIAQITVDEIQRALGDLVK